MRCWLHEWCWWHVLTDDESSCIETLFKSILLINKVRITIMHENGNHYICNAIKSEWRGRVKRKEATAAASKKSNSIVQSSLVFVNTGQIEYVIVTPSGSERKCARTENGWNGESRQISFIFKHCNEHIMFAQKIWFSHTLVLMYFEPSGYGLLDLK